MSNENEWQAIGDGCILSNDFTHDVLLRVDGDFESKEQEDSYIEKLVEKLNG